MQLRASCPGAAMIAVSRRNVKRGVTVVIALLLVFALYTGGLACEMGISANDGSAQAFLRHLHRPLDSFRTRTNRWPRKDELSMADLENIRTASGEPMTAEAKTRHWENTVLPRTDSESEVIAWIRSRRRRGWTRGWHVLTRHGDVYLTFSSPE